MYVNVPCNFQLIFSFTFNRSNKICITGRMGYHSADIIDLLIERGADVDSNLLFIKNQMEIMSVVATRNMTRTHVLTQEEMKSLNIPVKE